ncbi:probable 28S ribosomal protein S6, mitochondrial [Stegodyphus dumicola]|uniref:probable 28S ribosomal protein S6, mitochondrial n=1 Tax=Stegodyphus dumicola TaxID=202533 RepID=UPI0015AFCFE3|nr:probable 28S ribosomal protein S6, mitochondrial [Stegodyphus dumicola]
MPLYEFSVLLKILPRAEVAAALKRIGTLLLDKGVIIRKLENHGTKDLPFRMTEEGKAYTRGSYFIFKTVAAPRIFEEIVNECKQDVDLLRHGFYCVPTDVPECTLQEEMQPPALRKSVQQLLEDGKKHKDQTKRIYRHIIHHTYYHDFM